LPRTSRSADLTPRLMPGRTSSTDRHVAADALLHPAALLAIAALLFNDHLGKAWWPGPVTGKLSDVAGLAFFPLLLVGTWELMLTIVGRFAGPSRTAIGAATAATAVIFMVVKTTAVGTAVLAVALGAMQWAPAAIGALTAGSIVPHVLPAVVVRDPTDLIALPALVVPAWIGARRAAPTAAEARAPIVRPVMAP
jgi:hypothetical protein